MRGTYPVFFASFAEFVCELCGSRFVNGAGLVKPIGAKDAKKSKFSHGLLNLLDTAIAQVIMRNSQ
jgi:hypothetical protein